MRVLRWASALAVAATAGALTSGADDGGVEKHQFEAETSRLLDIIIHSLYSNKDVFLRELVSNAVDALDKIRFLSLENPDTLASKPELEVRISFDKDARTLSIQDSGIGMTKEDLVSNLGTVARSGTTQFVEAMASKQASADLNLIGQFGVGFYAAYLVADKVEVRSKHNDDPVQHVWASTADSSFTVAADPDGDTLGRGTEIRLHLKEDALEYATQERVEALVKQYSEFAQFPIYLRKSKTETVSDDDDEEEDDEDEDEDEDDDDEEEEEDEVDAKPKKTKEVTTWAWERVNKQQPIWTRSKSSVSPEQYQEFYKSISRDYADALTWAHFRAEGEVDFTSLLYIPSAAPMGMMQDYYNSRAAVKLYVRKVLIADNLDDLLPKYMNFVRGVVDSNDLPLKVDREGLQQSKVLKVIGKKLARKVLETLRKMSEAQEKRDKDAQAGKSEEDEDEDEDDEDDKPADYAAFWKQFSKNVKLGVLEDQANRNRLVKLLRFKSSRALPPLGAAADPAAATADADLDAAAKDAPFTSLEAYVSRMPAWQKDVYFLAGTNMNEVVHSPFLERARAKGVEVLLMDDALDEYVVQQVPDFESHKLQSLAKEGLRFGDETDADRARDKLYRAQLAPLVERMQKVLGDKVEKVSVSNRVTDSPAVLVASQFGYSANMEKIMKHQAFGSGGGAAAMMGGRKILEVNPRSPIVAALARLVADRPDAEEEAADLVWVLFDTALLNSGFDIDAKKAFSRRMQRLMKNALGIDSLELLPEADVPAEEPAGEAEDEEDEGKIEL